MNAMNPSAGPRVRIRVVPPLLIAAAGLLGGCYPNGYDSTAAGGFGIVREHIISAPRNDPPILSTIDYTIASVDGKAPVRERVPPWVDLQPGVLLTAGSHRIVARAVPHLRPKDHAPKELSFTLEIGDRKVYDLVDDPSGNPHLVEVRPSR